MNATVLVTTHERPDALRLTLRALAKELASMSSSYDIGVLVVDDGSARRGENEEVVAEELKQVSHHYIWKTQGGASSARNWGIRALSDPEEVVVIIGDDQIPGQDFLARHVAAHSRIRSDEKVLVAGFTQWWSGVPVTPFMYWLDHGGPQYRFSGLKTGWTGVEAFYTSNASARLHHLRTIGQFDEELFPFDDTDFGLRAKKLGYRFWFVRDCTTFHNHPQTLHGYCARMRSMGSQFHHMAQKHPELSLAYHVRRNNAVVSIVGPLVFPLRHVFERGSWPGLLYWLVTRYSFYIGYRSNSA